MNVGDRVLTPKGSGVVTRIEPVVHWAFREPIQDSEIVVKLDDKPDAHVRPVFLASSKQVEPFDDDVEVVVEIDDV